MLPSLHQLSPPCVLEKCEGFTLNTPTQIQIIQHRNILYAGIIYDTNNLRITTVALKKQTACLDRFGCCGRIWLSTPIWHTLLSILVRYKLNDRLGTTIGMALQYHKQKAASARVFNMSRQSLQFY